MWQPVMLAEVGINWGPMPSLKIVYGGGGGGGGERYLSDFLS